MLPSRPVTEAALFESGRPIVITPAKPGKALGENVVIAWNNSTETARTVALSMPLLADAGQERRMEEGQRRRTAKPMPGMPKPARVKLDA